jgi:hypothetical protein
LRTPGLDEALTAAEVFRASRLAGRLVGEFRRVCRYIPAEQRGGSALSRLLSVDRSTCQRLIAAVDAGREDLSALVALPGPDACLEFVHACARLEVPREELDAAMAACEEYRSVVRELGRSKAGLVRRLRSSQRGSPSHAAARGPLSPGEHDRAREHHFAASAEIAGRWSDVHSYVWCFRRDPDSDAQVQSVIGIYLLGHESRIEALPLMLGSGYAKGTLNGERVFSPLGRDGAAEMAGSSLLPALCSSPLPSITARQHDENVEYVLGTDQTSRGTPVDIAVAHRTTRSLPHPRHEDPPRMEVWYMSTYPARHLVMDVYLDRELARACLPSAAMHAHSISLTPNQDRWSSELPHRPPLRILPRGADDADCAQSPRQGEFVRTLLDGVGWSARDLIGYRIELDYPVWRVGHVMSFQFERA